MTDQRLSYVGQNVYVGVDVHKDTYTVTCMGNKRIVKTATVQADPAGLAASLPRWFQGATLSSADLRGGVFGIRAASSADQSGITNLVVNPASVAVAANDKVKTDQRETPRNWLSTSLTVACKVSTSLRKKRNWHVCSRAHARRLSSTVPRSPGRSKRNCTSLA